MPVIGAALAVQERFGEIRGTALANGIALQIFVSLFPLLVGAVAILGFVSAGDPEFVTSTIERLELSGDIAEQFSEAIATAEDSRRAASIIGIVGLLYSGLNLVAAVQRSVDAAWQTHGRGLRNKLRALLWLVGAVVILACSVAASAMVSILPTGAAFVSPLLGLTVDMALFLWTFSALGRVDVGVKGRLPGAVLCAVGLEILKFVGGFYVPMLVSDASALYGSLGVVFAALAWLAIFGRLLVYGSVLNVVTWERRHGTSRVALAVPSVPGSIPVTANRTGAVIDRHDLA